ncbi:hypothetical protein SeLEV6574_g01717 [Synchytrium endobioticum]|uniref:Uncharacterized protein n=1 Tax=Synchytrium endobioticum TaxID=286115 RepID=A0A507DBH8_9FUNG|nr:hypothetical protein SeLEV6574_g01717 [Synchytrium endobioticum]
MVSPSGISNSTGFPTFGQLGYQPDEHKYIQQELGRNLGPELVSHRPGPSGSKVPYIEQNKAIQIANEVFGFNGWSSSVVDMTADYVDIDDSGRISIGISVICRVTLKDGAFHEDCGYGQAQHHRDKGQAFDKAKKEACTDALKRALRLFGNPLGNCLSDKNFANAIAKLKAPPPPALNPDELYRAEHFRTTAHPPILTSIMPHPTYQPPMQPPPLPYTHPVILNNATNQPPPYLSPNPNEPQRHTNQEPNVTTRPEFNGGHIGFHRHNTLNEPKGHFVNANSRKSVGRNGDQETIQFTRINDELATESMNNMTAKTNQAPVPQALQQPPLDHKNHNQQSVTNMTGQSSIKNGNQNSTIQKTGSDMVFAPKENDLTNGDIRSDDNQGLVNAQHPLPQNLGNQQPAPMTEQQRLAKKASSNWRERKDNNIVLNLNHTWFTHPNAPRPPPPPGPAPPGAIDFAKPDSDGRYAFGVNGNSGSTTPPGNMNGAEHQQQKQEINGNNRNANSGNTYVIPAKRQRVE